jgi:hypothetical protein
MTVPELRARLDALTGGKAAKRLTKGQLLNYILEAERKASNADDIAAAQAEQDQIAQDDNTAPPAQEEASAPAVVAATESNGEPKGSAKADKLQNALYQHGWAFQARNNDGDRVEAVLVRGSEVMTVVWHGGVFSYEETGHLVGDRHTKVRNVSAAIKLGSRPKEEAEADLARVVANTRFKPSAPRGVSRSRLPFDPATVSDDLLWHAVMGKTIEWVNRVSNATETAVVSKSPKFWRVLGEGAERTLQFTSETGFRACLLSQIVRVGGSTRRRTQPQAMAA